MTGSACIHLSLAEQLLAALLCPHGLVYLLVQVSEQGLEAALTTRTIATRGEKIVKCLDADAAAESRDALAKTLYARLFDWLVAAINRKIGSLGKIFPSQQCLACGKHISGTLHVCAV